MTKSKINTSAAIWFTRGLAFGTMLFAAVNLASYHFLSDNWNGLTGLANSANQSIGLPFVFWQEGNSYGGLFIDYASLGVNLLIGLGLGIVFGLFIVANRHQFNRWVAEFESAQQQKNLKSRPAAQFSIKSMMVATGLVALLAAGTTTWAGTSKLLWFVYLAGPATLIGIAFLPRQIRWKQRVVILLIGSLFVIGGAIWTGILRGMDFEKVLLGITVFWTPQGAFAALVLMIYLYCHLSFRPAVRPEQQ